MKDATFSRILAFFVIIFMVAVAAAVTALININRSTDSRDWVNHTYATISAYENILAAVRAGDADMHTYALSGNAQHLQDSRGAFGEMDEYVQIADALTRDTPVVQAAVREVAALANQRAALADSIWRARRANETDKLQQLLADDAGSGAIGEIKRRLAKLSEDQFALLRSREQVAFRQAQTTRWIVGTGIALNLLLLCGVGWLIRDDLRARRRAAHILEQANAQLEEKVQARTLELTAANRRLTTENYERKWAAESQEHQLRYNQTIINCVHELVFVLTRTLTVTRINPAVVRALGLEEAALLGQPMSKAVGVAERTELFPTMLRALADGHELQGVRVVIGGRQAMLDLFPLRDRDKVIGGIAIARF